MDYKLLEEYSEQDNNYKKSLIWKNSIGLQGVDNLEPSRYLIENIKRNIDDELPFYELVALINTYYQVKNRNINRVEEADKVSIRIAEIISDHSFTLSSVELINIHKFIFQDVFEHAGKIRTFNISKKEWVLDGKSVIYGNAFNLKELLEYDFKLEQDFSYNELSKDQFIKHLAKFISNLWQLHIFEEGNTRTIAVFLIKYLYKFGFDLTNDTFYKYSWYFRNALVRANYSNYKEGIKETTTYLELFLRNLLFGEHNKLSNKELHINYKNEFEVSKKEEEILNILKNSPNITIERVALEVNKSVRTIKSIIKLLVTKGYIERVGSKKTGYWQVTDKPMKR